MFEQLLSPKEYEDKYKQTLKTPKVKSRSLGNTDWMEQAGLGTLSEPGLFAGMSNTANIVDTQNLGGMMITTCSNAAPSQTYTMSSALSMK